MSVDDIPEPYRSAHRESFRSREQLLASRWVGCFYCCMIFGPKSILEWVHGGKTALCPVCWVDSVLPLTAEQFDSEFLLEMRKYWFAPAEEK